MEQEVLYKDVIENLTTAIIILDDSFRVHYINSSAEILFDISQRQADHIPLQAILPGEKGLFQRLILVGGTGQELIEREIKLYIPAYGELMFDCAIKLIAQEDDKHMFLLEFYQLDTQERISRDDSLHVQEQVVRGLAHEIKNPLGGLRGAAQLLERQLESDDLKEYTGIIINEADRLQNLLASMLGPNQQGNNSAINIHQVLQRVRQLVAAEVDDRLSFKDDYDPSIPDIYADFDQLVQVFLNIVSNAVQAMNGVGNIKLKTRIKRQVSINNQRYKVGVGIDVIDDGPGIPPSMQDSMFYPLVTGRAEGTGLGLYISQSLIHRNRGAISCKSRPGNTVFSIVFPLDPIGATT